MKPRLTRSQQATIFSGINLIVTLLVVLQLWLLEREDSPQQGQVEREASQARQRRRPDDRGIPAQPGVHRRRQQP